MVVSHRRDTDGIKIPSTNERRELESGEVEILE